MMHRLITELLSTEVVMRRVRERAAPATTVLMYHELLPDDQPVEAWTVVTVSAFRRQMEYLREHFDILSIDEALSHRSRARPAAVLTFDDGGAGNHSCLLPVVAQLGLPVAVFVATAQIEAGRPYWFDRVINALQVDQPVQLDLRDAGLGVYSVGPASGARNWARIQKLLADIKQAGVQRNDELADLVERRVDRGAGSSRTPLRPMTIAQLRELARCPNVTIGAHSHSHSLLTQLSAEGIRADVSRSRALLQEWTGQPVMHFAYPSGAHDAHVREQVVACGFVSGFGTEEVRWRADSDPFSIPRIGVGRYDPFSHYKLALSGGAAQVLRGLV